MPDKNDILWFKTQCHQNIQFVVKGTPFTIDMLTAIACQETGYIWGNLRNKSLGFSKILELCVGDTIDDTGGRKAFPLNKADLLNRPNGGAMFNIARQALEDMAKATGNAGYLKAAKNPNKFCHGFGIFQYDLQFFKTDPVYFLRKEYSDFGKCMDKCLEELKRGLKTVGLQSKTTLTDLEMAHVAIAYNTGGFKPGKGLKQGYFNGTKYYGEEFFDFLKLSQAVAILGPGSLLEVAAHSDLRLRNQPKMDTNNANVIAHLPNGHVVQAATGQEINGFMEVNTDLQGTQVHGFASAQFLKPV